MAHGKPAIDARPQEHRWGCHQQVQMGPPMPILNGEEPETGLLRTRKGSCTSWGTPAQECTCSQAECGPGKGCSAAVPQLSLHYISSLTCHATALPNSLMEAFPRRSMHKMSASILHSICSPDNPFCHLQIQIWLEEQYLWRQRHDAHEQGLPWGAAAHEERHEMAIEGHLVRPALMGIKGVVLFGAPFPQVRALQIQSAMHQADCCRAGPEERHPRVLVEVQGAARGEVTV